MNSMHIGTVSVNNFYKYMCIYILQNNKKYNYYKIIVMIKTLNISIKFSEQLFIPIK